jgi:XTP/dITP diphosphohydrolase
MQVKELIFATNNENKVKEIKSVVGENLVIISLKDAGIAKDIPEPHQTLEANATEKSTVIHELTGKNCFSEDTGLEVFALHGEPGVKSARYAGDGRDFQANIDKLLEKLTDQDNRSAQFRTVISLIWEGREYLFEGICKGRITEIQQGVEGFGYDPIFIPDGAEKTFATMTLAEKNEFSHRKKATTQLIDFLNKNI